MTNPDDDLASQPIAERYQLEEMIKDGPHALIWRAFDHQSQSAVVLKIFKPGQIESVEAFEAHMRRIMPLKFPGLLAVRDFSIGDQDGFVVYDCLEGASLRDFVNRQILSTQQIIRWMIDLGETLEYVHSKGLVHQNITPANILIDLDGQPLLTDFGPGYAQNQVGRKSLSNEELRYLSPEQLEGKPVDARSDLYSLAVVMHELLTGRLPYQSINPNALSSEILQGAHVERASIPFELRHLLKKALARNPADRYASTEQFVNELRHALLGGSTRQWAVATAGVILFLAGFAISGWVFAGRKFDPKVEPLLTQEWINSVKRQSAANQLSAVVQKLKVLNPDFDGEVQETVENDAIVALILSTDAVKDISPLKALVRLKSLTCVGSDSNPPSGKLIDLAPLQGMTLTRLVIHDNERITDLAPLAGMPLAFLDCGHTSIADLTPIRALPLQVLICRSTNIVDLAPLAGMTLKELYCDHTGVTDLSPLDGMPLEELHCSNTQITNLGPLKNSPLKVLDCYHTLVSDLAPLHGQHELSSLNLLATRVDDLTPLKDLPKIKLLWCDFDEKRDRELLKSLNSLRFINDNPVSVIWQEASRAQP